jgi:hypothetical protein
MLNREMLSNSLVHGKPILLLCNKTDIDPSQVSRISCFIMTHAQLHFFVKHFCCLQDEVELVSNLNVESLVNSARCPTRYAGIVPGFIH